MVLAASCCRFCSSWESLVNAQHGTIAALSAVVAQLRDGWVVSDCMQHKANSCKEIALQCEEDPSDCKDMDLTASNAMNVEMPVVRGSIDEPREHWEDAGITAQILDPATDATASCADKLATMSFQCVMDTIPGHVSSLMKQLRGRSSRSWPPVAGHTESEGLEIVLGILVDQALGMAKKILGPLTDEQLIIAGDAIRDVGRSGLDAWKGMVALNAEDAAAQSKKDMQHVADCSDSWPCVAPTRRTRMKAITKRK